jgi:porin
MLKGTTLSICAAFLLRATCDAAELTENTAFGTAPATPTPDFQSLRIKGLTIALPGPQDTIDPDFAGSRAMGTRVCTENLNADVVMMKSAEYRV